MVFGGEAKALADLMKSAADDDDVDDGTFEEERSGVTEMEEGMTDILAAVQASQLRDRHFAYNPTGQAKDDYHSSDEDSDDQVGHCTHLKFMMALASAACLLAALASGASCWSSRCERQLLAYSQAQFVCWALSFLVICPQVFAGGIATAQMKTLPSGQQHIKLKSWVASPLAQDL